MPAIQSTRLRTSQPRVAKSKGTSPDELAQQLATGLTISKPKDVKGKRRAPAQAAEDERIMSMRTVNEASQSLSSAVESGWKASGKVRASKASPEAWNVTSIKKIVQPAMLALVKLRELKPGDMDIERAALSIGGKLVSLEMYSVSTNFLSGIRPVLMSQCLSLTSPNPSGDNWDTDLPAHLSLLCLPIPSSPFADPDLLTLISTYLVHSLIATLYTVLGSGSGSDSNALSHILFDKPTLLKWIPHLSHLPAKHLDSLYTRAYTAAVKSSMLCSGPPDALLQIRVYGLLCLLHTSPATIEPDTFWDQATKFFAALVKSVYGTSRKAHEKEGNGSIALVCSFFSLLASHVENRSDRAAWSSGRGFIECGEYCMNLATRIGDIALVDKISGILQVSSSPSQTTSLAASTEAVASLITTEASPMKTNGLGDKENEKQMVKCAKICATLTSCTAYLESIAASTSEPDDFSQRLQEARSAVSQCRQFIGSAGDKDDEGQKVSSKVRRALEKLRRITVRLIEDSGTPLKGEVTQLATDIIAIHEHTLSQGWVTTDVLTPAVESLFLLARTTLSVANPNTHTPAYDFLAHAKRLVSYCPSAAPEFDVHTHANYVRCLSGAFYNTAGTLYQASRHAAAIRFLQQGCELGAEALRLRDNAPESQETKQEESWKQLREQLHRRWELLGVCYSKISERKLAYEAFVQCIKAYPFANTEFVRLARSGPCGSAFDVSPTTKQLGTIVDRVTYIAACELFRQPGDVSLSGPMEGVLPADDSSRCIVGAILERQVDGLDGSKWKDGVENVISALLTDCLAVYEPQKMPIRRARVLVRCLEASYYGSGNAQRFAARHPDEIGDEVGALLSREHYGEDAELVHFVPQYWAAARLWQALHAHRLGSPKGLADIPTLLEQACDQLKPLALPVAPTSPRLSRSPVVAKKAAPSRATKTSTKRTATRRAPAKSSRQHPVTPPKARKALELMSTNALQTAPPQQSQTKTSTVLLDNFEKFFGLLEMAAQLLNLLGYVLARVRMLNVMKRLADRHGGHDRDGYVKACIDLAHEYVKLGKIEKAGKIYGQALTVVRSKQTSEEAAIFFLLRYAESLAVSDNILRSSTSYCEAMGLNECLHTEEKGLSTLGRVRMRVGRLERAASACTTFSVLQHARDEPSASTKGLLQALRLWNRALDSLARLRPSKPSSKTAADDNPFDLTEIKEALPSVSSDSKKTSDPSMPCQQPYRDGLEWRVANGLLSTLFGLAQAYFSRGSAREAEYFIEQAFDLAHSLNAPAAVARALARKAEIQLRLWRFEESHGILGEALKSLPNVLGPDVADVLRLKGDYHRLTANVKDAQRLYDDAAALLDQLESMLTGLDGPLAEGRRSSIARGKSSVKEPATADCIVPALAATVLRQQIWLLREEGDDRYQEVLHRFLALPASAETKAEEVALMAKLTLQDVYNRFRGDMFLSSLAESTISIPMGCLSSKRSSLSPVIQDIISTLANSERLFWSDLSFISRRGQVPNVRSAILALALVRALQSSLGRAGKDNSMLAAGLLDHASAVALRRELLEAIDNKFLESEHVDDVLWPAITPNGSPLELPKSRKMPRLFSGLSLSPDGCAISDDQDLRKYWSSISDRCHTSRPDVERLSISHVNSLPRNWSIINICIAEDKSVMFVSRRTAGRQPTMFCLPLGGRRDVDEEEHLSYDAAIAELRDIIRLSDEGTRQAGAVKQSQEKAARVAWWAERNSLDNRLKALLENIEFCWLGGFKTILGPLQAIGAEVLTAFQARLDRIVRHGIKLQEKKYKSQVRLDDSILEWICSLSPQCHDEELEDLVYFILDFYQLHGTQVAIAEVDVDQVVVDLRMLLEDYSSKLKPAQDDEHMFLVVDRNAHEIPWESLPILRGRSVSRIPNSDFLFDRLDYARLRRGSNTGETAKECLDRAIVNPSKAYYVLNPSGDLKATEGRFRDWVTDMRKVGWDGIIGRQPSELEFVNALSSKDLLIYFGHGGGEQYIRSHRVRHLKRCAATMLWGCSSGTLRDMGDFDPIGTPYNYMLAGCPTLVANLWDVTDRDIDKFSQAVFDELDLTPGGVQSKKNGRSERQAVSVVKAVAQSRDACKLKYLTGAAPVVYGIPFYL